MRSASNKSCKENQHTHFVLVNVGKCGGARGHRQYGTCTVILDKKSYTRVRTPAHPHPRTHTQKCVILIAFSTATVVSRTHLGFTLYAHCLCGLTVRALLIRNSLLRDRLALPAVGFATSLRASPPKSSTT